MTTTAQLSYEGAGGDEVPATLFSPSEATERPAPGLVVAHDVDGHEGARAACLALAEVGYFCLLPDLWSREVEGAPAAADDSERWTREARLPDRRALEDLDRAVRRLAAHEDVLDDGVGTLGLGTGGTLAFLLGCTSRDVGAVATVGGRMLYPELSSSKPTQPLELLLNLDRPLLAFVAEADPDLPEEHLALWRQKLDASGKDYELVVYPGQLPAGDDPVLVERLAVFLRERL